MKVYAYERRVVREGGGYILRADIAAMSMYKVIIIPRDQLKELEKYK